MSTICRSLPNAPAVLGEKIRRLGRDSVVGVLGLASVEYDCFGVLRGDRKFLARAVSAAAACLVGDV